MISIFNWFCSEILCTYINSGKSFFLQSHFQFLVCCLVSNHASRTWSRPGRQDWVFFRSSKITWAHASICRFLRTAFHVSGRCSLHSDKIGLPIQNLESFMMECLFLAFPAKQLVLLGKFYSAFRIVFLRFCVKPSIYDFIISFIIRLIMNNVLMQAVSLLPESTSLHICFCHWVYFWKCP